jgi:lambda repressor-like predicted transcriptional regulator
MAMKSISAERREIICAALARGASQREAAKLAGVNEKTVKRHMVLPAMKARIAELREAMLAKAVGVLSKVAGQAAVTLAKLLDDPTPTIRLRAAVACLEQFRSLRELAELDARIRVLEEQAAHENEYRFTHQ